MSTDREIAPIRPEEQRRKARQSFSIVVAYPTVLVGTVPVLSGLGFTRDQALKSGGTFAQQLYHLSEYVASQKPDDPDTSDYEQQLDVSLKLDKTTALKTLTALRKIGAGLRAALSQDVVDLLKFAGFLKDDGQEEPLLTFQEGDKVPILWEMLYEGGQEGSPDWQKFWGFRAPITHWVHQMRTDEIQLRGGFFSAINEDLDFAEQEVTLLKQQFQRLSYGKYNNLADEIQKWAKHELQSSLKCDTDGVENWLAESESNTWLRRFLNQLAGDGDEEYRELVADQWKRDHLIKVFKGAVDYNLFHFACHCEASEDTEFLSRLDMMVGGEQVSLDVSLMATDLKRELQSAQDPGPLVFLNACGTAGKMNDSYEPPGFPDQWIRGRGALAVIATLCPVPDYFAHAFAHKFYELLFAALSNPQDPAAARNCYVAEALLATRRFFMQEYNNPLGLAYVLYAVKGAHVVGGFALG